MLRILKNLLKLKKNRMEITKESLISYGMKVTDDELFPLKKGIGITDENEDEEDVGELAICVTVMRNESELCLSMPDGSLLYLNVESIEELVAFEKCIGSFEFA